MLEKCRGIILHTLDYAENSVVMKCYTDRFGLQSYMINGVKGKKAAIKPSQLLPLTLVELEVYHQQQKNLQRIKELRCTPMLNHLHFEFQKSTLALFMAELLTRCLREENQRDEQMFDFIFHAVQIADLTEGSIGNLPVYFMVHLSKYLGFFPKSNYSKETPDFSLHEGLFISDAPKGNDFCPGKVGEALNTFCKMSFEEIGGFKVSAAIRSELLSKMIRYYQMHVMLFGELKSPAILHEVLAD